MTADAPRAASPIRRAALPMPAAPQVVARELRRLGLEVTTGSTLIGSDADLREAVRLARLGGRQKGEHLRPRHINAGRLAESQSRLCATATPLGEESAMAVQVQKEKATAKIGARTGGGNGGPTPDRHRQEIERARAAQARRERSGTQGGR